MFKGGSAFCKPLQTRVTESHINRYLNILASSSLRRENLEKDIIKMDSQRDERRRIEVGVLLFEWGRRSRKTEGEYT